MSICTLRVLGIRKVKCFWNQKFRKIYLESLKAKKFFLCWPSSGGHLFWPPSMVYISVIIYTYYKLQSFHMLDLCGQLSCNAIKILLLSTPVFLTCGYSSCLYFFIKKFSLARIWTRDLPGTKPICDHLSYPGLD